MSTWHTWQPWRALAVTRAMVRGGGATQYTVENVATPPIENWDAEYVNIGGFFGPHNPATFAAAPKLLAALRILAEAMTALRSEVLLTEEQDAALADACALVVELEVGQ